MKISWVVPVFNSGVFLSEALESIARNKVDNVEFEILVVDDCSTDPKTLEILDQLKLQKSVIVIRQVKNSGPACARNKGIENASGDWIGFLDSDDILAPGSVPYKLEAIKENPDIKWFAGEMLEIKMPGEYTHCNSFPLAIQSGTLQSPELYKIEKPLKKLGSWIHLPVFGTMLLRKDLMAQIGPINEKLIYGEDIHFCLAAASLADLYWVAKPGLFLRRYHESMVRNLVKGALGAPKSSLVCLKDKRLSSIRKELRWTHVANLRRAASVLLDSGHKKMAFMFALKSVLWGFNDGRTWKILRAASMSFFAVEIT
jgi:glycosyltransferase involved in cell wall biosynthesis